MNFRNRRLINRLFAVSLSIASTFILLQPMEAFSEQNSESAGTASNMLQGSTAAFGVLSDDVQARLGFSCALNAAEDVVISNVLTGTAAATSTLKIGDHIIDARAKGNAIELTIERDGKLFKTLLIAIQKQPVLLAQTPRLDKTVRKPFTLNAEQTSTLENRLIPEAASIAKVMPKIIGVDSKRFQLQADKDAKLIADYKLELIVDRSMSMKKDDCPDGLSRWAWCGEQAAQLSNTLAPYTPNGLTIIPFATEFDVFEHATPQNIQSIFQNINLQFGTRLFEPLTERLDDYFVHRQPNSKPLLIVVITDGVPFPKFEPALVKKTLIEASQKMKSKDEVVVIFCQIGSRERFGQRYLADLEDNLQNSGARYAFVHQICFEDLQTMGLGPALASKIKQFAPMKAPVSSTLKAAPAYKIVKAKPFMPQGQKLPSTKIPGVTK